MVEGAIYMPLVILCVAFTCLMLIHYYTASVLTAHVHMEARRQAGEKGGKVLFEIERRGGTDRYRKHAESQPVSISDEKVRGRDAVWATARLTFLGGRLVGSKSIRREFSARAFQLDEEKLVRVREALDG
jgi:hypothetical protein